MHILVSECISKGLNEDKFALLNTANKSEKKIGPKKNDICVLQCYYKTTLKIMKKKIMKTLFLFTTHHYFSAT